MNIIKETFTDAKGRPEIKMIIGVPATIVGFILGIFRLFGLMNFAMSDWGLFMGIATGLIGVTAVADAFSDHDEGNAKSKDM